MKKYNLTDPCKNCFAPMRKSISGLKDVNSSLKSTSSQCFIKFFMFHIIFLYNISYNILYFKELTNSIWYIFTVAEKLIIHFSKYHSETHWQVVILSLRTAVIDYSDEINNEEYLLC